MFVLNSLYFKCAVLLALFNLSICGDNVGTEITRTLFLRLDLELLLDKLRLVVHLLKLH